MNSKTGWPSAEGAGMYQWMWPAEVQDRVARVEQRAREVFGSSTKVGVWLHAFNPAVRAPEGFAGNTLDRIKQSEEAVAEALAELDRLAPITKPEPEPDWSKFRRGRRRW